MMKKTSVALLSFLSLFFVNAQAQMINGSTSAVVQHPKPTVVAEPVSVSANIAVPAKYKPTPEEVNAIIEAIEQEPPTEMTLEQKKEIEDDARESVQDGLQYLSIRQRKDMVDILELGQRKQRRREALAAGKTPEEVDKEMAEIKKPDLDFTDKKAMEKYVFEKMNLAEQPKVQTINASPQQQ